MTWSRSWEQGDWEKFNHSEISHNKEPTLGWISPLGILPYKTQHLDTCHTVGFSGPTGSVGQKSITNQQREQHNQSLR